MKIDIVSSLVNKFRPASSKKTGVFSGATGKKKVQQVEPMKHTKPVKPMNKKTRKLAARNIKKAKKQQDKAIKKQNKLEKYNQLINDCSDNLNVAKDMNELIAIKREINILQFDGKISEQDYEKLDKEFNTKINEFEMQKK